MEHLPLLLGLLVLGLIIFGPQKMIEMAGSMGRMLRELRAAMKEMNWNILGEEAKPKAKPTTLGMLSQLAQDMTAPTATTTTTETPSPAAVVEASSDEAPAPTEQPHIVASEAQRES